MEKQKVRYRDLSAPLKFAIVGSWMWMGYMVLLFIVGFMIGMMEV